MFTIEPATALWFLPPMIPIAVWIVWSDLARMKIPNKAVLATLAVFAILGPIALGFDWSTYLWRYAHFAVVLVIGFVITSLGLMGAGDSKFMAAMAPFLPLRDAYPFLFLLAFMMILSFILHRVAKSIPAIRGRVPHWESWERKEFPLGVALAPALIAYLLIGAFA